MVCVQYFGSFNPIHYGHIAIAEYVAAMPEVDSVRLVVSPHNPIKKKDDLADAKQRFEAVKTSFDNPKISVSDVEFHLPEPLYTINTLRFIQKQEPLDTHILLIGADNLAIIEKWHSWSSLLNEFSIWVYPRPGFPEAAALCRHYSEMESVRKIKFLAEAPQYDISSTMIRGESVPQH
jgi:nicotinate-nucleotide adenylyltransferase